jgi:hypothetical protein
MLVLFWGVTNLPHDLKLSICKAIEKHTFNSSLQINLDISSISSLPEPLVLTFSKLLQHASHVDNSMKDTVLEILKLITEYPHVSENSPGQVPSPVHFDPCSKNFDKAAGIHLLLLFF